jgi:hypothetical protein
MPDNLECAAYISAASLEIAQGAAKADGNFARDANLAMMWHLNSWAVPQNISEPEAFARLKERTNALRESKSADQIVEQAQWCIANRPG